MTTSYAELHLSAESLRLLASTIGDRWRYVIADYFPEAPEPRTFTNFQLMPLRTSARALAIRSTQISCSLHDSYDYEFAQMSVGRTTIRAFKCKPPYETVFSMHAGERILHIYIAREVVTEVTPGCTPWQLSHDRAIVFELASGLVTITKDFRMWDEELELIPGTSLKDLRIPDSADYWSCPDPMPEDPDQPEPRYSIARTIFPIDELIAATEGK